MIEVDASTCMTMMKYFSRQERKGENFSLYFINYIIVGYITIEESKVRYCMSGVCLRNEL